MTCQVMAGSGTREHDPSQVTPEMLGSDACLKEKPVASLSSISCSAPAHWTCWEVGLKFLLLWCNPALSAMTCQVMAGSGTQESEWPVA